MSQNYWWNFVAQWRHRAFFMVCAWEMIPTPIYTRTPFCGYQRVSSTYPRLCHAKVKYLLSGAPAYRFSSTFWYFPSAISAESVVPPFFRHVHLNQKFEFLEVFAVFRGSKSWYCSENTAKNDICLDWLKMTPYIFIRFSCARHWKCAVHTKWPYAYIFKCAYVLTCFRCFSDGSANESAFVHTRAQNHI